MTNRLARETSPYLLQHAENPVDWWAWGPEAFAEARRRDVPIFLSIGYSTCYWCHVMERESFESADIARAINENFVAIKVDREERPDVDEVYMAATLVMRGHGGWPMSAFLEPGSLKPYFCGTYFPPEPRHGIPDFPAVLASMSKAWREQREAVMSQSEEVAKAVREHLAGESGGAELGQEIVADALSQFLRTFDRTNGGFGDAPKFPQPAILEFMLDVRERAADDSTGDAIDIAMRKTLDAMMLGGIRDQLGGGFHRYAVDVTWTVPHFEKMLYDNAALVGVYARAARRYGDREYARVVHETVRYVCTRLGSPHGAFLSAQDAETGGREGDPYLWTPEEVRGALCPPELAGVPELEGTARAAAEFAVGVFGLGGPPNFRDPHHPEEPSKWVLRLADRPERLAGSVQLGPVEFVERVTRVSAALLEARDRRAQARTDDKVIAAWNGMMIAALATASRELEAPAYLATAERAMDFVLRVMRDERGGLLRTHRGGISKIPGLLEDYGFVMQGLLEIARCHEGEERERRVSQALGLLGHAKAAFFEDASGMVYDTRADAPDLFVRTCSLHDGALASGFSAMVHAMIDLTELTGDAAHSQRAVAALAGVSGRLAGSPAGSVNSVRALLRLLIAGESPAARPASAAEVRKPKAVASQRRLPANQGVVQVFAGVERVEVKEGEPAELTVLVQIAEGWHVPAADPGKTQAGMRLIPFRVDTSGGTGVRAYADYPAGQDMGEGELRVKVYSGTFELRVALEREGALRGHPRLVVKYQPCSASECLEPVAAELDIGVAEA
ncbi:hypothetical protein PHYC_02165 [Phycisphaerales bacterium]|nr:hypothetical protein PHYC_02165 [Phycisphaerales bacterium]